jgi:outer membrane receptor protein involved in Fe transport
MAAPSTNFNPATGTATLARGRVPNGTRYRLYGFYLQDTWQPWASSRLRVGGAVRYGGASYRSRADLAPRVHGRPLFPGDSLLVNAWTGRVGVVYQIASPVRVHFNHGREFRAPGMTDLGALGLQGNGAFEAAAADLVGRGALLGDQADDRAVSTGLPVRQVRPETSNNLDLGVTWQSNRVRAELTAFGFDLNHSITSQTLLLPLGATGQTLGDQIITRPLPTGPVFVPVSTRPVLVRGNDLNARSYGLEHRFEAKLARHWTWAHNLTTIFLRDQRTGVAPDIGRGTPPPAHMRLRYAPACSRFWVELYATLAGRQCRLSPLPLVDRRRVPAPTSRASSRTARAFGASSTPARTAASAPPTIRYARRERRWCKYRTAFWALRTPSRS